MINFIKIQFSYNNKLYYFDKAKKNFICLKAQSELSSMQLAAPVRLLYLQCQANILCAPLQPVRKGDISGKIQPKAKFI